MGTGGANDPRPQGFRSHGDLRKSGGVVERGTLSYFFFDCQVSGRSGEYYDCPSAAKGACENRLLVRRTLSERIILASGRDLFASPEVLQTLLMRVEEEVRCLYSDVPETIRIKQAEFEAEERRVANFVDFIGEGRGSEQLAKALEESGTKVRRAETPLSSNM